MLSMRVYVYDKRWKVESEFEYCVDYLGLYCLEGFLLQGQIVHEGRLSFLGSGAGLM